MNADEVVEKVLPDSPFDVREDDYRKGFHQCRQIDRDCLKQAILSGVLVPRDEQATKTPNPS